MKNWLAKFKQPVCFIFLLAAIYFIPYYQPGLPITHDGENHVARFAQYFLALRQGQLIPRIAPTLDNNFGVPVFNFNYPLANILSLPFSILKLDFELTFKIIIISFFVLGGISCYFWLKKLFATDKKTIFPLLASSAFLLAPYLYQAIWYRGNIGEAMIYCLTPAVLLAIENIRRQQKFNLSLLIVALTSFFLAHNIMVLFLTPFILLYALWRLPGKNFWHNFIPQFLLALTLVAWFWLPALGEKSFTVMDQAGINQEYTQHFLQLEQLGQINFVSGLSFAGQIDGLSFGLGLVFLLTIGVSCYCLILRSSVLHSKKLTLILLGITFLLIFLQTNLSQFLWQVIPLVNFIQFPWRLSLVISLILVILTANLSSKKWLIFCFAALLIQSLLMLHAWPKNYFHKTREDYLAYPQSTTTRRENTAKTFTFDISQRETDEPIIAQGNGELISIQKLTTSAKEYLLNCRDDCLVIEQTANFPGFQTTAHSQTNSAPDYLISPIKLDYVDDEIIKGRLAYRLPAGIYRIRTRWTEFTPARLLGDSISVLGAGYLLYKLISQSASLRRRTKSSK